LKGSPFGSLGLKEKRYLYETQIVYTTKYTVKIRYLEIHGSPQITLTHT